WIGDSADNPRPIGQAERVSDQENSKDQRKSVGIRLHQDADDTEPDDLQGDDQKARHKYQGCPDPDVPRISARYGANFWAEASSRRGRCSGGGQESANSNNKVQQDAKIDSNLETENPDD